MRIYINNDNYNLTIELENKNEEKAFISMITGEPLGSMVLEQLKLDLANQLMKEVI